MKNFYILILIVLLATQAACNSTPAAISSPTLTPEVLFPSASATPDYLEITPTPEIFIARTQAIPADVQPPAASGTEITFAPLSFVVPATVASGATGSQQASLDSADAAWWMKTPGHLLVSFDGYYALQGKSHLPQIYVFPAQAYGELVPAAFEALHRLNNILYDPAATPSLELLPAAPFYNDVPMFASHIQVVEFQNGRGVRFVTQSAQFAAPANNQDLFYHFEGVTTDGVYYIVVILPITSPLLAATNDAGDAVPSGGISYPRIDNPNADFPAYYTAITELLNAAAAETFTPSLSHLDALIRSMLISP